ncbi:conserved repeat domain-containing protein/gliding motility-associated C-terminal domain-containing protein [Pricia antarctica]|uniref:Conserved repeat domain-containing protein/gliding motility-associated C-terminal domain-containing protein n=1 Tax=Pricia antarctica TaxID=641691 RepID=A0A1G7ADT0_9FLAO|nr:gliding motility-associated C-terminal domain-containing protein [Pricia antarctica]SDE13098.1 conserved repeat domain-containing protein/gliding motility-associated C-terminal domain-containing protein [Pricia antarctica]
MKLKREYYTLFGNAALGLKWGVFFLLLFAGFCANAQIISITSADSEAGEGPGNPASFTITRTPPNNVFNSTVVYSIAGTAESGLDYTAPVPVNNTVTLSSTQPSVTIPLNGIIDDNLVEGFETIVVTLETVNFGFIIPSQNTVTLNLTDNDGIFTVSTVAAAAEQGSAAGSFTVSLDKAVAPGVTLSLPYELTGSTAVLGTDYTIDGLSTPLTFQEGTQSRVLNIIPVDDEVVENDETVLLTLGAPIASGGRGGGFVVNQLGTDNRTITITDNDIGTFTVQTTDADAAEEGSDQGGFLITLDKENGTGTPVTVPYTLGGTAIASDYTANGPATPFTFPAGQLTNELLILPVDDTEVEGAETVILNLGAPNNTTKFTYVPELPAQRTVTIADNDCAAGTAAPLLNATTSVFCDAVSVNLDDYVDAAPPANIDLVWSPNPDPSTVTEWLPNGGAINAAGTYYGFFADTANNCYSPTVEIVITQNTSPSAGTPVAGQPTAVCSNQTTEFGPNQIDLANYITGQAAGAWTQSSGPNLGANINGSAVDFRGQEAGTYEFTYTTNTAVAPCTNATSVVTLTVSDCDPCVAGGIAPILTPGQTDTFCGPIPEAASLNDFTSSAAAPPGTTLVWTTNGEDLTDTSAHLSPAAIDTFLAGDYYAVFYDAVNNCASPPLTISIKQNDIPEISAPTGSSRCGPGTLQLSATGSLDATLRWYTSATGGAPIRNGANFTTPNISQTTSYFVEAVANGCVSPRTEVVATVIPQPSAGVPRNTSSCNAAEFGTTVLDLDTTLIGTPSEGVWSLTEGPSAVSLNAENIVDFQGSAGGSYVFTFTTTGAEAPCENTSAEVTVSVSSCDTDDDGDGLLGGLEAMLGTDPNNPDTDGDGINDDIEVGDDIENPLDEDEDGIIDALDSNTVDTDLDGINDQQDPANENACVPNRFNGQCDTDGDGISDLEEDTNGSDPDDPCSPNETPTCADPIDLQVVKEVDKEDAIVNDDVVFTVTVNNLSDRKAINVTIGDLLETGFETNADSMPVASVGAYDTETGMWTIPEIAATDSATLTVPVKVLEGGPYVNTAELLSSIPVDGNPDNNVSTVTLNIDLPEGIDLILEKSAAIVNQNDSLKIADFQTGQVNPLTGQEIIFKLKVTNDSNEETVSRIEVLDSISPVFVNPRFTPELGEGSGYDAVTGRLTWFIPDLMRNGVAELEIRVSVDSVGTFQNTADIDKSSPVDSEGKYDNNTSTVTVNVSKRTEAEFGIIFNQFSPNNDGVNDDLKINKRRTNDDGSLGDEVDIQYGIKIFNRYGSLVFEGEQLTDEVIWDGTRKGKDVPDGTYFYVLDLTVNEEIEGIDTNSIKKGWIQLIR